MVFIDLYKAYGKVPRDLIRSILDQRSVPKGYINIIKDMYEGEVISMGTTYGETSDFNYKSYLFTKTINEKILREKEKSSYSLHRSKENLQKGIERFDLMDFR